MMQKPYALVLSGGGAKGSYQIGVWKALRELGIRIEAVAGTSVGALNATLIAQDDFDIAWDIWSDMSLTDIVELPGGLVKNGKLTLSRQYKPSVKDVKNYLLQHNGLNTGPLRQTIERLLNEKKIKKNGIDLGLVTYNLKKLKPLEIFYSDMGENRLKDYLLASTSFPFFKRQEIDGIKYIDGGIYDNIPYSMIVKRGYTNIIVVDISGRGRNRKHTIERTATVYIKNSLNMGSVFDFNPNTLSQFRNLGYLDTKKIFGEFDGIHYFYKKDDPFLQKISKAIETVLLAENRSVTEILPRYLKLYKQPAMACLECCAIGLGIPAQYEYTMQGLANAIRERYLLLKKNKNDKKNLDIYRKSLSKTIRYKGKKSMFKFCASDYDMVLNQILMDKKKGLVNSTLNRLFPELPATRVFIYALDELFKN